jgi:hypothetical protein
LGVNIAQILKVFGWFLVGVAAALVIGAACSALWVPYLTETVKAVFSRIVAVVVPAGLLVSFGALLLTKAREAADTKEKRSLFYLDSCVISYQEAQNLLADGNNDRAAWIAAARALKHAQRLSTEVEVDEHRRVLEVHQLKYRRILGLILWDKPGAFFYGAQDTSVPIAQAAAASTAPGTRGGRIQTSTVKELSEESLHAVWESAQWPTDYADPLVGGRFSEEDDVALATRAPGLYEYLQHKKRYDSASGNLWPLKPVSRREQDA